MNVVKPIKIEIQFTFAVTKISNHNSFPLSVLSWYSYPLELNKKYWEIISKTVFTKKNDNKIKYWPAYIDIGLRI